MAPLLLICALAVSCDWVPSSFAPIGLSRDEAGRVILSFYTCPGESITRISVVHSRDGVVGNKDDDIYWEITSEGATTTEFVVGETPSGFTERAPLTRKLPPAASLSTEFTTTELGGIIEDFEVRSLPQDGVDLNGEVLSESEFRSEALSHCKADGSRRPEEHP